MNFAFTTVLVLVFLIPGTIYRRFYYVEQFSKQYQKPTYLEHMLAGFFASIVLHIIWYYVIRIIGYSVDLRVIGQLLMAKDFPADAFDNIQENFGQVVSYHLSLFIFSGSIGTFMSWAIRKSRADRKYKIFRFQNIWHYITKGQFMDFPRADIELRNDTTDTIDIVSVDVLVEGKNDNILYEGILVDYELTIDGGLDFIYLRDVVRRYLKPDSQKSLDLDGDETETKIPNEPIHHEIPGHVMILPYAQIMNINFTYCKITMNDSPATDDIEYRIEMIS